MNKRILLLLSLIGMIAPLLAQEKPPTRAILTIDFGIDNLERRYYRPEFRFQFPLMKGDIFFETRFHHSMNGSLQGKIDYWVNAGYQKLFPRGFQYALRLNHFCRHQTLRTVGDVFNLNELVGLAGWGGYGVNVLAGGGTYVGGTAPFRSLAFLGGSISPFIIPELTLAGEFRWVDFQTFVHEAALYLRLAPGTELFVRNTGYYEDRNMTLIGLRLSSRDGHGPYLDQVRLNVFVSPDHRQYKLSVDGVFQMQFFRRESSRLVLETAFTTPILNGTSFFGEYRPDRMLYGIRSEYQLLLSGSLRAFWYGQYRLDQPVDRSLPFAGELGTGLGLRNQEDFCQLEKPFRFELAAGVNFKKGYNLAGGIGFTAFTGVIRPGILLHGSLNERDRHLSIRLFLAFEDTVAVRPFIGYTRTWERGGAAVADNRWSFGVSLLHWFH